MIHIYTCGNCNSIISTSLNANFFTSRFDACELDLPCLNNPLEIVLFICDNDEYAKIVNDPFNFEFILTLKDIKCKYCGNTIGILYKEQSVLDLIIGNLYKNNINCFDIENECPKDIQLHSQFESDTLTSLKEIATLTDTLDEYSKLILTEDVIKMKNELNTIETMINQSGVDKLQPLCKDDEIKENK